MSAESPSRPSITLYRGWLDDKCYVWSPFVTKVEFFLRLCNVSYVTEAGSPLKAPKGKIPYIDLDHTRTSPSLLGDSTLIIKRLVELGHAEDLNAALSSSGKVQDLAVRALLEEKLCFYNMRERWLDNYYLQRDKALWSTPFPIRAVVGLLIYRKTTQTLHGQGTGRHTTEEIETFRREIWEGLNDLLESRSRDAEAKYGTKEPFWVLGSTRPTEADASLFGFITSVLVSMSCPESTRLVRRLPGLLSYAERIHDKYFADYEKWPEREEVDSNVD